MPRHLISQLESVRFGGICRRGWGPLWGRGPRRAARRAGAGLGLGTSGHSCRAGHRQHPSPATPPPQSADPRTRTALWTVSAHPLPGSSRSLSPETPAGALPGHLPPGPTLSESFGSLDVGRHICESSAIYLL